MRVLFLTHRLPFAPNRGDRVRAYHIARLLAAGSQLHIVSLAHDASEIREADRLRDMGIEVSVFQTQRLAGYACGAMHLPGRRPLTHCLLDAPGLSAALGRIAGSMRPDVVLAYCSGMARFALEPALAAVPLVLDMVDVDSEKWAALGRSAAPPMRWVYQREARCLRRFEAIAARHAQATLVVNEREQDTMRHLAPGATVHVVGNGVDLTALSPPHAPADAPHVVFCGVMDYVPNVEGVRWFVESVWPLVRAVRPDARFTIVGARPTDAVRRLALPGAGVDVTGTVPDVREYLWTSVVSVAPLLTARGLQNKVLEALAAGLPCVVSEAVAAGLPAEAMPGCRVANTAEAFARDLIALLAESAAARREIASRASLDVLSWERQLAALPHILERAARVSQRLPDGPVALARSEGGVERPV